MHIDHDSHLTIAQVAAIFGNRVSYHSIRRWIAQGVGKPPVRLAALRIGKRYYVRRKDVDEFIMAINEDPAQFARRKSSERTQRAKRRLVEAGA